jgi:Cof subfamily protein (haloacid dehalogenase superfamily)
MTDKPIRLIATDIDGTLLNSRHEISPRNEQALRRAMQQGVQVVLATGKTYLSGVGIIRQLGLTTPGVYVQGLAICGPDGSVLHSQTLNPDVVQHVASLAEVEDIAIVGYEGSRLMMPDDNDYAKALTQHHEPQPEIVGPLSRLAGAVAFNKLIVMCEPENMPELRQKVSQHVNGSAGIVLSSPFLLEIVPLGTSKGAGLAWLLDYLGVPADEVLALGDAENDVEMLQMAGVGAAMGNAMSVVKDAADIIVASNDDDGLAEAVERFVLR